jgi:hypothetical protein
MDLPYRLKSHLYRLLTNNLTWEYKDTIESWKLHIEVLADAQKKAADQQLEPFKKVEEERARSRERSMLVFTIFSDIAFIGFGAVVEHIIAPKFTTRTLSIASVKKIKMVNSLGQRYNSYVPWVKHIKEPNEVANKIYGDIAHETHAWLKEIGIMAAPKSNFDAPNTGFITAGLNSWDSFKTGLLAQLSKKQQEAEANIRAIANAVENDVQFGEKLVAKLLKESPHLARGPDSAREQAGQEMINKLLNEKRTDWAKKWLYYGNDPPSLQSTMFLPDKMEAEMWRIWVLEENLEAIKRDWIAHLSASIGSRIKSKSEVLMEEPILTRLFEMGAPVSWFLELQGYFDEQKWMKLSSDDQVSLVREKLQSLLDWAANPLSSDDLKSFGVEPRKLAPVEEYTKSAYRSYKD